VVARVVVPLWRDVVADALPEEVVARVVVPWRLVDADADEVVARVVVPLWRVVAEDEEEVPEERVV
jgi:hypothetical protein